MEQAGEEIGRIVAALPLRQRLAFTLRKVHELEYEAIGRSLDCSARHRPSPCVPGAAQDPAGARRPRRNAHGVRADDQRAPGLPWRSSRT